MRARKAGRIWSGGAFRVSVGSVKQAFDVVILGAGAAGLMCAIEAGRRGKRVAVVERAERAGKKILISGGGRCNFTNLHCTPENFLSSNPHFCKSALARYAPADFVALVEKHKIPYHEKTLGQLFCDRSSRDILNLLEEECRAAGVRIFLNTPVKQVWHNTGFEVDAGDITFSSPALVVATGGLSIPKIGATAFGYELAEQFGLAIRKCRPGLVPLLFDPENQLRYCDLAGVSAEVVASCGSQRFREMMLITHRGLSGPAILQISSYWKWKTDDPVLIDLAPEQTWTSTLREPRARRDLQAARSALRKVLPVRWADRWMEQQTPRDWTNRSLDSMEAEIHGWEVSPAGTEGYPKAEVTAGGVDTGELSSKTMESRKVRGLFFIGEVVDVTGQLGGFNFQWAWASGVCAGQAVAGSPPIVIKSD
jgi:predicted Rossmann fold flavoprotein